MTNMKPSQVAISLRRIASAIQASKNPDKNLVARDLKKLISAITNNASHISGPNLGDDDIEMGDSVYNISGVSQISGEPYDGQITFSMTPSIPNQDYSEAECSKWSYVSKGGSYPSASDKNCTEEFQSVVSKVFDSLVKPYIH